MAVEVFTNNPQTTLNGAISNSTTTIVVSSNSGFPTTAQFRIIIDSEIMLVTAGMGGTSWTVTRGNNLAAPDTTTNATHANLATVTHVLTAGGLTNYVLNPVSGATWAASTLLTLASIANNYGLVVNGPVGAGTSFGVKTTAGTNASDFSFRFQTQAAVDILYGRGDGQLVVGGAPAVMRMPGVGQSVIVGGTTGLAFQNNAGSANNIAWTDAGILTARNAVEVPPSAGAALPTHSYGTLPVKLDEQSGASTANTTLTVPAGALYRTLVIHFTGRSDNAAAQAVLAQFNADAGANYDYQYMSDTNATVTGIAPTVAGTSGRVAVLTASGATAGAVAGFTITIYNADSTTLRKNWTWDGGWWATDAAASATKELGQGQWRNTAAAVTSIKLTPSANNLVNWRATLYGWP